MLEAPDEVKRLWNDGDDAAAYWRGQANDWAENSRAWELAYNNLKTAARVMGRKTDDKRELAKKASAAIKEWLGDGPEFDLRLFEYERTTIRLALKVLSDYETGGF